ETAADGGGRSRTRVGLVVERDVAGDDGNPERLGSFRYAVDRLRQLPADLGLLRVAEVEAVGERERLASGAGDVARRVPHGPAPPPPGLRGRERGACAGD